MAEPNNYAMDMGLDTCFTIPLKCPICKNDFNTRIEQLFP